MKLLEKTSNMLVDVVLIVNHLVDDEVGQLLHRSTFKL